MRGDDDKRGGPEAKFGRRGEGTPRGNQAGIVRQMCSNTNTTPPPSPSRLELSPTLPSKLDDEFIFNKTIGAKTQSSAMFAPSDSSMTETTLVDYNDSRDLSYLTVNENYSCLMFDCGLEKPRRPSEKKRTSTSATAFFGGLEEGGMWGDRRGLR